MKAWIVNHGKLVTALVGAVVSVLSYYFVDIDWVGLAAVVLTLIGIERVPAYGTTHGPRTVDTSS